MTYTFHNIAGNDVAGRGRSAARQGFAIIRGGKCCQCENVANSNFQLSIGNIGIGNWQHFHTGNIPTRLPRKLVPATNPRDLSHPFFKGCATLRVSFFCVAAVATAVAFTAIADESNLSISTTNTIQYAMKKKNKPIGESPAEQKDRFAFIDLFAGAGGLSEGLEEAGFHGIFASEIVPQYADTYRKNHPGTLVITEDIRKLDAEEIRKRLGLEKGELALIAGGPPCQGFSINAPVRSVLDQRNHLFKEYLRFVDAFQPRAVLIENVPGLVSFEDGDTLHAILTALGELGYGADVRILGAAYYGVPQMRWRTIILGVRGRELPRFAFPEPICHAPIRANFTATFDGRSLIKTPAPDIPSNFVSVAQAISDLPPLKAGERGKECKDYATEAQCDFQRALRRGSPGVFNHEAPRLSAVNLQRLQYIKPGGNWTDIPHDLLPKGMKAARKSDHTKRYGRLTPDGLASTVLTKCDPHWGAYFHYSQDRSLTVREAARIQSFPDHYIFYGSQQEQFAQVGNAVPPMLAKAVGVALMQVLSEED